MDPSFPGGTSQVCNVMIAVIDVIGLYTNIPHDEGVQSASECLEERPKSTVPSQFIVRLLELILKYNIFEFDKSL